MGLWFEESFPALILVLSFIRFSFPRSHRMKLWRCCDKCLTYTLCLASGIRGGTAAHRIATIAHSPKPQGSRLRPS